MLDAMWGSVAFPTKRLLGLAALAVAVLPGDPALAHGIGGSAVDKSVPEFVWLGALHMLAGWDHLLFITGVVLLAGNLRTAAKLITAFVVGHSITLLIATLAEWQLDATLVDVVIALSLVYVGIQGIRGRPDDWRIMGAAVFGFGLIHGLGLSTRLQDLGLPEDGLLARVVAFNVGVELGQLAALTVIVALGTLIVRRLRETSGLRRPAFGALAATGLAAAALLSFTAASADDDASQTAASDQAEAAQQKCERTDTSTPPPFSGAGGHPAKSFYEPGEMVPEQDLGHVIGDGYVIVRYRDDLPDADRDELSTWIAGRREGVIAAPQTGQEAAVEATTAYRTLTCDGFDLDGLRTFSDEWFADVQARRVP